ncbi:hypothetical protein RJT34_14070 [Clitoria ternatea]|uniref:Major facilitator superfamily (MFS) profile domain-containing protein n=1 Tax=Clitoria ternatea TaxID=43366 RepID=A0AAN9PME3_CLITE
MPGVIMTNVGEEKEYPGKLTMRVFTTCVVAAFGGLIFGYDLGISGGVMSMDPFLKKFFPDVYEKESNMEASDNQYCKFDSFNVSISMIFTFFIALGWLVPSEIFPLELRSTAQSLNVSISMIFTFFIAQVFTTMLCHMKFGLFIFFAFFVFVMTIFIYKLLPETKGVPIEEMFVVWQKHPYWKKFVKPAPAEDSV